MSFGWYAEGVVVVVVVVVVPGARILAISITLSLTPFSLSIIGTRDNMLT